MHHQRYFGNKFKSIDAVVDLFENRNKYLSYMVIHFFDFSSDINKSKSCSFFSSFFRRQEIMRLFVRILSVPVCNLKFIISHISNILDFFCKFLSRILCIVFCYFIDFQIIFRFKIEFVRSNPQLYFGRRRLNLFRSIDTMFDHILTQFDDSII